jgi:predicted amidohydrolase
MSRTIDVACLQLGPPRDGNRAGRIEEVAEMIAALAGTDLVVLPEMWPNGYFAFDDYASAAEPADGPTVTALAAAAAAADAYVLGGTFVEGADGTLHNTAVLIGPDGAVLETYRKMHVFGYRSREAELVTGGSAIATVPTALGRVGLGICYDLRFPELFRAQVDEGAELLIVPAAWPAARVESWRLLLRARAIENQCVVVGCNGAGTDNGVTVGGHSVVLGAGGEVLAEGDGEPGTVRATVDLDEIARIRREFPVLDDRRLGAPSPVAA